MSEFLRQFGFGADSPPPAVGRTPQTPPPRAHPYAQPVGQPYSARDSSGTPYSRSVYREPVSRPAASVASPGFRSPIQSHLPTHSHSHATHHQAGHHPGGPHHQARSPQPQSQSQSQSHVSSSPPPSAPGGPIEYASWSVDSIRSHLSRHTHSLGVMESRLQHCFDNGDPEGASVAAQSIVHEKRAIRELSAELLLKERRATVEERVRTQITHTFGGEKATVHEHRRQVRVIKQRLRVAFAVPGEPSPVESMSDESPSAADPAPQPNGHDFNLFDLLARAKHDLGRHQVSLEHQCLRVDSIDLQGCVDLAQSAAAANEDAAAADAAAPPITQWSDELTVFFKTSRKDVVTTLQSVLTEVDGLTQHLKHTEAFMDFLK